jgi:WD40 repeat protein
VSTPPDPPSHGGWSDPGVVGPGAADPPAPVPPPERYVVGALLGAGGMGTVHAARDLTLGRDVALKELRPELGYNTVAAARLSWEAAITSRLDHPGIVSVHDAGRLPDGRPFYTMRLVRGRTLARAATEAITPDARRQLVRHVLAAAEALAAAHDAGVVHRDVKPANVLIGPHGETQVVDWGLATPTPAAAGRWADLPAGPAHGSVGTAPYTSPEQARGEPPDPRHDVWSLGVTLAEVIGAERDPPPELAAIVARATAPKPAERYPNAAAFAEDLLRWFEGRRVGAYVYTPAELLRRTLRAYRLPVGIAVAGALAITVAVGIGWWQTTNALGRALGAEANARAALADLRLEQAVSATRAGAREQAERLAIAVLRERADPLARGVLAAFGRAERPALLRDEPGPTCAWSAMEGAGGVACGARGEVTWWEGGRAVWTAPVSARGGEVRGDVVLAWDATGTTTALDVNTGEVRARWPLAYGGWLPERPPRLAWAGDAPLVTTGMPGSGCEGSLQAVSVSDQGRVAAACGDGTLVLGRAGSGDLVRAPTDLVGDHVVTTLAWTPDGRLVAGALRGRLAVFDGASGARLAVGETGLGALGTIRVSADGSHAAVSGAVGGVGLWRLDTATAVGEIPAARPHAFAFVDGGLRVHEGRIRTWRLPTGAPAVVPGPAGLADLAVRPDGAAVALAGGDGGVTTVTLADGRSRRAALGDRVVKSVAFDASGGLLASGMAAPWLAVDAVDGTWAALPGARRLRRLAWLGDGQVVGADLHAGLYRWPDRRTAPAILSADRTFVDLERDGDVLVTLDAAGRVDRMEGTTLTTLATSPDARAVALRALADGRGDRLAIASADGVELRDSAGVRLLAAVGAGLLDVALSPDGARVAAAGLDGDVRVWDAGTGALVGILPGHTERVVALEFLPDGDLASASWDKSARFWSIVALDRPVASLVAEIEAAWGASTR